jgi:hypothetical protein
MTKQNNSRDASVLFSFGLRHSDFVIIAFPVCRVLR